MEKNFFLPAPEAPNRIPEGRFAFLIAAEDCFLTLECRHGLVLIVNTLRKQILVLSGHGQPAPPGFKVECLVSGVVLRAAADVHHFQVVLVGQCERQHRVFASVYSSVIGAWGNLISTPFSSGDLITGSDKWDIPAMMIQNSLYWLWLVSEPMVMVDRRRAPP
jgi:hypothetical protein